MEFFKCKDCGTVVLPVRGTAEGCQANRQELVANSVDAAKEKHVPEAVMAGGCVTVQVGSAPHPMLEKHYIEWICLETVKGHQLQRLQPGQEPRAEFQLAVGDKPLAVYAYCNLHGLWKKEI